MRDDWTVNPRSSRAPPSPPAFAARERPGSAEALPSNSCVGLKLDERRELLLDSLQVGLLRQGDVKAAPWRSDEPRSCWSCEFVRYFHKRSILLHY